MSIATIVFKKELTDALRDRRSIFTSIVLPLILFPVLLGGMAFVQKNMMSEQAARDLKVGIVDTAGVPDAFIQKLAEAENITVERGLTIGDIQRRVDNEELDGVFLFSKDFIPATTGLTDTGYVNLYYKEKLEPVVQDRLRELVRGYGDDMRTARYDRLGVTERQLKVVEVGQRDLSSPRETLAAAFGGMVPYMFIIIAVSSCMFMAMDLGVGEKERGTLETLLTTAASRTQILTGKLMAISTVGFAAACLSLAGLWLSVYFVGDSGGKLMEIVLEILHLRTVLMVLSLLLPLVVLFAALELSLSIYANNTKEAQSLVSPLIFVAIFPALLGAIPGFELNTWSALVPVFNITLATKAVLAGTASPLLLLLTFLSTLAMAAAAVAWTVWWFQREKTLFRG